MSAEKQTETEIEEFLPHTEEKTEKIDNSKAGKYKKQKTKVIVFPDIKQRKSNNNGKPMNTKNVEELQNCR